MNLHCKMGFHKYRDLWRGDWTGKQQEVHWKCLRCGHEQMVTIISPLSGPRKGPMHPEAADGAAALRH